MNTTGLISGMAKRIISAIFITLALTFVLFSRSVDAAEPYPNKPVHIIVPYAAGGVADAIARAVGQELAEKWKQPVIVDNRPGAAGNIGMSAVANAAPDGYTLALAPASNLTVNPILFSKMPFDTERDFTPISLLANSPNVLVVHPSVPVKSIRELIAYAKANPNTLNYASAGVGSGAHLAAELLNLEAGIKTSHVSFNGLAPAITSLLGGHVQMMFAAQATALPLIKSDKLVALAVASPSRLVQLKGVPTVAESGYPGFDVTSWYGLVARSGTPREIIQKINGDVAAILGSPNVRTKMEGQGVEPASNTPEAFAQMIKAETAKWREVVRRARIEPIQ